MRDTIQVMREVAFQAGVSGEWNRVEAVVKAAQEFAGQPGVRLPPVMEAAWLDLRRALAALENERLTEAPNGLTPRQRAGLDPAESDWTGDPTEAPPDEAAMLAEGGRDPGWGT